MNRIETRPLPEIVENAHHPLESYFRSERLPHIWCSGCGLGTVMSCFAYALLDLGIGVDDVSIVSGIGCTGRLAGYMRPDSYHTTHGRAIPFASGLRVALSMNKPGHKVVVFSGDGDLFAIGGNHFIHAARRNLDIAVFCVNNFNYGMTGGQSGPTTPQGARGTTAPYGTFEHPFNLPYLAASCGAPYVARWTTLHARRLKDAMVEALVKSGFTFVEIISPCPINYGRRNQMPTGLIEMQYYFEKSVIRHFSDPKDADITPEGEIVVGTFVDQQKPDYFDVYHQFVRQLGQE
jgi:2-oxoglutarate ferredoxin oxidoreductase subunit beta